jgi:GT2 family glycosyltransferase
MIKVLAGIPCFGGVEWRCLKSVYEMDRPEGVSVRVEVMPGYGPAQARNKLAAMALDQGFGAVLYVDSDQVVPENLLARLLALKSPAAAGWSMMTAGNDLTNISNYNPEKNSYEFFTARQISGDVIEVDAVGFSAVLVEAGVFRLLSYPFFDYVEYPDKSVLSEDLFFCDQLRKLGIKIKCDTALRVKHLKMITI